MITITTIDGFKHEYIGNIVLHLGDTFITVCSSWQEGEWCGNIIDSFWPEEVKSIYGSDGTKSIPKEDVLFCR